METSLIGRDSLRVSSKEISSAGLDRSGTKASYTVCGSTTIGPSDVLISPERISLYGLRSGSRIKIETENGKKGFGFVRSAPDIPKMVPWDTPEPKPEPEPEKEERSKGDSKSESKSSKSKSSQCDVIFHRDSLEKMGLKEGATVVLSIPEAKRIVVSPFASTATDIEVCITFFLEDSDCLRTLQRVQKENLKELYLDKFFGENSKRGFSKGRVATLFLVPILPLIISLSPSFLPRLPSLPLPIPLEALLCHFLELKS
jgi:hypothetical protein